MKTNIRILFEKHGLALQDELMRDIENLIKEKTATQETWLGRKSIEDGGKWYANAADRVKELGERILNEPIAGKEWDDVKLMDFAFGFYQYCSGVMKVPFNKISENKIHAEEWLSIYRTLQKIEEK